MSDGPAKRTRLVDLAACEEVMDHAEHGALASAVAFGLAAAAIREQRFYQQAGYDTFDAYCRDARDMRREQVDSLIRVALTAEAIEAADRPLPRSQAAVLALAPVADDPDRLREVIDAATINDRVTATSVRAALAPEPDDDEPYRAELADPDGWRKVIEQAREREPVDHTVVVPETVEKSIWLAKALLVECAAHVASVVDRLMQEEERGRGFFPRLDDALVDADVDTDEVVEWVWHAPEPTFRAWSPLRDFWVEADRRDWFDVRGYVASRLTEDSDDSTTRRAVAVLGLLGRTADD